MLALANIGIPRREKKNMGKSKQLTVVQIDLFPPTRRKYPRFDYEQVTSSVGIESGSDDDEMRDLDAEAIVKRIESKYGASSSGKSSKKRKNVRFAADDIIDKGIGYDATDTFIDDSQAYDEWVPSTMDTLKGGHYVNKGVLEFKQFDSDESSSSSSEESESDEDEEDEETSSGNNEDNGEDEDNGLTAAVMATTGGTVGAAQSNTSSTAPIVASSSSVHSSQLSSITGNLTGKVITKITERNPPQESSNKNVDSIEKDLTNQSRKDGLTADASTDESDSSPIMRLSQAGVPPTRRIPLVKRYAQNNGQ